MKTLQRFFLYLASLCGALPDPSPSVDVEGIIARVMENLPAPRDGKDADMAAVRDAIKAEVYALYKELDHRIAEIPKPGAAAKEDPSIIMMPRQKAVSRRFFRLACGPTINVAEIVKITNVPTKGITAERFAFAWLSNGEDLPLTQSEFDSIVGPQ